METQMMKVPHLRNAYTKVGMFRQRPDSKTPQIRGFGYNHDGSVASLKKFFENPVFNTTDAEENDLTEFTLAFDTNMAPVVGQQVTLTSTNAATLTLGNNNATGNFTGVIKNSGGALAGICSM